MTLTSESFVISNIYFAARVNRTTPSPSELRTCCTDIGASLLENQCLPKLTIWSRVMLEKLIVVRLLKISLLHVELERSLLCSEEPTTSIFVDIWFTE
jgi:hypothetical protein